MPPLQVRNSSVDEDGGQVCELSKRDHLKHDDRGIFYWSVNLEPSNQVFKKNNKIKILFLIGIGYGSS